MNHSAQVSDLPFERLVSQEWLVTNSVGGFASSTIAGLNTRRYHGLLVASMTPPVRRMVLLSRVEETVRCSGREFELGCNEYPGTIWPCGHELLRAFSIDPHPRWAYQGNGWTLEKELQLLRGENTVVLSYALLGGGQGVDLDVRPLMALRGMHDLSFQWNGKLNAAPRTKGHWRIPATRRTPEVFFASTGDFDRQAHWYLNQIYRRDAEYGYAGLEDLWSPGVATIRLMPGQTAHFACSSEPFELDRVVDKADRQVREADARLVPARTLVAGATLDADASLADDADFAALARATSDHLLATPNGESYGVAGQYHWSPPSVRMALAGFSGLYLVPGRLGLARSLLATLSTKLELGLLPTDFPTDGSEPKPRGADVSLWYVHAVRQYLLYSGDEMVTRQQLLPAVLTILDAYQRGTERGISMDADGLLRCGGPETPTTWMDHCANGQPVTPRHGRPVEINALWYNALQSGADLCRRFDRPGDAEHLESLSARVRHAFNARFWNAETDCLFDVVGDGGNDASVRPNQLFAASLPYPVLSPDRWSAVVRVARDQLLTPVGLRTLSPQDSRYVGRYAGDVLHRDAAAHNGAVYPWLLGPYVSALMRITGRGEFARNDVRALLKSCLSHLTGDGLGHIPELADGDAPHGFGGAMASALSAAELFRVYAEDVLGRLPKATTQGGTAVSAASASRDRAAFPM